MWTLSKRNFLFLSQTDYLQRNMKCTSLYRAYHLVFGISSAHFHCEWMSKAYYTHSMFVEKLMIQQAGIQTRAANALTERDVCEHIKMYGKFYK